MPAPLHNLALVDSSNILIRHQRSPPEFPRINILQEHFARLSTLSAVIELADTMCRATHITHMARSDSVDLHTSDDPFRVSSPRSLPYYNGLVVDGSSNVSPGDPSRLPVRRLLHPTTRVQVEAQSRRASLDTSTTTSDRSHHRSLPPWSPLPRAPVNAIQ